jgi:hypothetical protein
MGYRVFEAADAKAALAILDSGVPIDLLFTDVILPGGMNGRHDGQEPAGFEGPFHHRLYPQRHRPYGQLDPGIQLLGKPFTYSDLAAKLRAVLNAD